MISGSVYSFCLSATPGRPSRPEVKSVTEQSATVTWKPPYDDGGDSVRRYVLQYKVRTRFLIDFIVIVFGKRCEN